MLLLSLLLACHPPQDSAAPSRIEALLAEMTLEEKAGQIAQIDQQYLADHGDIATSALGSLLSGGGSAPGGDTSATPAQWREMVQGYAAEARESRLGIPLVYGIDAVHGHNNVHGATLFPHHIGLGATRDADLVERIGRATAEELAATGIHWTFAPCIAVARDERWGRTYESFSEDPAVAAELGAAEIRGLQGDGTFPAGVLATAKHFAGDGGTVGGDDQGDTVLDAATFAALHLAPYVDAVGAGVGTVMASYSSWNGVPMHANGDLMRGWLEGEQGFEGFIVSDWGGVAQLSGDREEAVATALNAGIDMVMVPMDYEGFIQDVRHVVQDGRVPEARLDDAVSRILRVKERLGLFDSPDPVLPDLSVVGSAAHRALAREAVARSLVVLQNDGTLPLSRDLTRIHVAGGNADDLGRQCGGWSITWQGGSGDITEGTTLLEAIEAAAAGSVTSDLDASGAAGADVAVVVIGEEPYAEYQGDDQDLALAEEDVAAVQAAAATGVPVVVVLVTGRPRVLAPIQEAAAALVVAWLPGTEGDGVADVLFGDVAPSGTLPMSWPASLAQVPVNVGDDPYEPQFPFGFGLTW
ncbi:MAG: glycoside hydrolase family 3 protein [Pseudomonadota bacterium]